MWHLVEKPHVAGDLVIRQAHEAERPDPVLDGDQDHVPLQQLAGPCSYVAAQLEGAAVDVHLGDRGRSGG